MTNKKKVMKRWRQYIEELYNREGRPEEIPLEPEEDVEDKGPELLKEEITKAIKELKNNKTDGVDEIPAEMPKFLGEEGTTKLVEICQEIYKAGKWPKDFKESITIPIERKQMHKIVQTSEQ